MWKGRLRTGKLAATGHLQSRDLLPMLAVCRPQAPAGREPSCQAAKPQLRALCGGKPLLELPHLIPQQQQVVEVELRRQDKQHDSTCKAARRTGSGQGRYASSRTQENRNQASKPILRARCIRCPRLVPHTREGRRGVEAHPILTTPAHLALDEGVVLSTPHQVQVRQRHGQVRQRGGEVLHEGLQGQRGQQAS